MNFEEAKREVLAALRAGRIHHEPRSPEKNLLASRQLSLPEAETIVARTRGHQASCAPHHLDPQLRVWIFQPSGWYIKFYFRDGCWFISFHRRSGGSS